MIINYRFIIEVSLRFFDIFQRNNCFSFSYAKVMKLGQARISEFDNLFLYSLLFGAKQNALRRIFFRVMIFQRFFFMILSGINRGVYLCLFEYIDTRKHVNEHSCLSVRVFLCSLAHSAHLAQSFFSLSNAMNR